ncbi:hypothetical protein K443DRAFT_660212, partial [Laccaria amethystina LaAM-08-1]
MAVVKVRGIKNHYHPRVCSLCLPLPPLHCRTRQTDQCPHSPPRTNRPCQAQQARIRSLPPVGRYTCPCMNHIKAPLAATLSYGIIRDHPFMDGNKCTAFFLANEYLRAMGIPGWANGCKM